MVETKYVEGSSTTYPSLISLDNDPDLYLLTNIGQGNTVTGRIGNDVNIKQMTLNFVFRWNSVSRVNYIRIMVCSDRQYQPGGTPGMFDFYNNNGSSGQYDIFPYRNWVTRRRLKILWSKVVKVEDTTTLVRRVHKVIKFRGRGWKTSFTAAGSTFAACMYRPIFLFVWSDSASGANGPTYSFYWRTTFKDA